MFKNLKVAVAMSAVIVMLFVLVGCGCGKTENPPDDLTPSVSDVTPVDTSEPNDTQIGDSGMDSVDLADLFAALPDKEALDEIFSLFCGYWTSGDLFVGFFFYENGAPGIEYGLYQTGFGARGEVVDIMGVDPHESWFVIRIPATPATEIDEAKPERTETVGIEISNYGNNRLNIKVDSLDNGNWHTYEFGGSTLADAYK
ncbi:MAG: hypothetical protein FWE86_00395 [Oscillospiraceae bacterium]|nr:hypothetical protein [Oscillospiraceae bacterium]